MALTQDQIQRLRKMPPEERRAFHTNRIATSLEAIAMILRDINMKLGGPNRAAPRQTPAATDSSDTAESAPAEEAQEQASTEA